MSAKLLGSNHWRMNDVLERTVFSKGNTIRCLLKNFRSRFLTYAGEDKGCGRLRFKKLNNLTDFLRKDFKPQMADLRVEAVEHLNVF